MIIPKFNTHIIEVIFLALRYGTYKNLRKNYKSLIMCIPFKKIIDDAQLQLIKK